MLLMYLKIINQLCTPTPSGFVIIKCVQCLFRFSWHCPPLNVIIAHSALESAFVVRERHAIIPVKS
jgi:hypothetical protein